MKQAIITINGRLYDALTGQLLQDQPQQPGKTATQQKIMADIAPRPAAAKTHALKRPSSAIHSKPGKSETLNRMAVRKPQTTHSAQGMNAHHTVHGSQRSPLISRHAPIAVAPLTAQPQESKPSPNTTPLHPSVLAMMQQKGAQQAADKPLSSKELKEKLIKEGLAKVSSSEPARKAGLFARKPRLASILASSLVLLILGGYFTYINLTNISMRVAASSAGINASFPGYKPDGYSLNGPITYAPGEVAISYKSNTNDSNFTLTQKASNWDSQAVLDNYVRKQTSTYLTFQQRGVTVYTFSNKAAWTNGGLLYTIEGDASLSSEQILRLATSM